MPTNEYSILASGPIQSYMYTNPGKRNIHLCIGNLANYGGEIKDETPTVIEPDALFVEQWMRGHGIGMRLVKQLVIEAKKLGVDTISGHIESQYALDIRAMVFGETALKFYYDNPAGSEEVNPEQYSELPITFLQARQSLERAEAFEEDLDYRNIGFNVVVDIGSIDTASHEWRLPV